MHWTDLPLARATVDRAAERRSDPELLERLRGEATTRVVLVRHGLVATLDGGAQLDLVSPRDAAEVLGADPAPAQPAGAARADEMQQAHDSGDAAGSTTRLATAGDDGWLFLGADGDRSYLARVLPDPPEPADVAPGEGAGVGTPAEDGAPREWSQMRQVAPLMSARDIGLGITAVALTAWHRSHRYCPRCGSPTDVGYAGWVRRCRAEGRDQYPRTDPAVIMAVVDDDDRILLGHAAHWPERRYSTLAGFVEPGEALEQAVRREVDEEVGIAIGEVTYRGSQPWPFPASIMLAFLARAASTEITVDGIEVTDARWFTREELLAAAASGQVLLPSRSSIARVLIEEWAGVGLPGD